MATATKNARTIVASVSLLAAGSTSGTLNLTTALGCLVTIRITPAGTLTVGATVAINVSTDNSTWRPLATYTSGLVSGTNYDFGYEMASATMYLQVSFTGATGAACTVEATGHELTSIA
jgi:hypothetical protein